MMMTGTFFDARRLIAGFLAMLALGLVVAVGTPQPSLAQEFSPEHLALARKFVDLTDTSKVYELMLLEEGVQTKQTLVSRKPDLDNTVANDAIGKVVADYAPKKGDLLDQFARHYALRFSMEELQQIVDFYETDVGQKLAKKNGEINEDLKLVLQIFKENLNTEFYAKVRANLKEAGVDL